MPGCTVTLEVILRYAQLYHRDSIPKKFLDLIDLVIFLTKGLQSTHSVGKELNDTVGLELALTNDLGGKEEKEEGDGLNGDLDAK
jgi:hypothetical protein